MIDQRTLHWDLSERSREAAPVEGEREVALIRFADLPPFGKGCCRKNKQICEYGRGRNDARMPPGEFRHQFPTKNVDDSPQ